MVYNNDTQTGTKESNETKEKIGNRSNTEGLDTGGSEGIGRDGKDREKSYLENYSQIQPAAELKQKKGQVAVLPKPERNRDDVKREPLVLPKTQVEPTIGVNTSRKWVLPPRPRPGRRPFLQSSESLKEENNNLPKAVTNAGGIANAKASMEVAGKETGSHLLMTEGSVGPKTHTVQQPENSEQIQHKEKLLARLKEQELIRNYIEVLRSQIEELSLVLNGMITFNALDNRDSIQKTVENKTTGDGKKRIGCEHLESVNNMNDLNKALSYMIRSSNVIHSVTKNFTENKTVPRNLNSQIEHYLEIRSKFKLMEWQRTKNRKALEQTLAMRKNVVELKNIFTPSLLTPLSPKLDVEGLPVEIRDDEQGISAEYFDKSGIRETSEDFSNVGLFSEDDPRPSTSRD